MIIGCKIIMIFQTDSGNFFKDRMGRSEQNIKLTTLTIYFQKIAYFDSIRLKNIVESYHLNLNREAF